MFLIRLIFLFMLAINVQSDQSGFISIDCGATTNYTDPNTGLKWVSDDGFTKVGYSKTFGNLNTPTLLRNLRYFPESSAHKYCYVMPVLLRRNYLLRTSYYYGDFDGKNSPPVFDQIIDGTIWGSVNTSRNYSMGSYTNFYEAVIQSTGKTLSLCLARNANTSGDPFISAIELRLLAPTMYNSTNFKNYGLTLVARSNFGYSGNNTFGYPIDPYDRFWMPFQDSHQNINTTDIPLTGFWNIPSPAVLQNALVSNKLESMDIQWPQQSLEYSTYYIALYFNDINNSVVPRVRVFNISFNGIAFFQDLNVSSFSAWSVFTPNWSLQGRTKLSLDPVAGSISGPLINAGEVFQLFNLGGRTLTRDVIALNGLKKSLTNVPVDWEGDPCLPVGHSWTGITCSQGSRIRVTILNLTSSGLGGSLSPSIANLTALTDIWLGNNNLSGPIPDLSSLKLLSSLHLEGNKLNGTIPESLTNLTKLSKLFLQNNELGGKVPEGLLKKSGLDLRVYPGNLLLEKQLAPATSPAPSPERSKAQGSKRSNSHFVWTLGLILGHLFFLSVNLQNTWCT